MTTLREQQKEETHAAILEAAEACLRQFGLESPSVASVMKRAGLTVGGFYAHFDSKEALMATTLQSTLRHMWQKLLTGVRGETPAARAHHVLRRYLSTKHRDALAEGCPLPSTAAEIARAGEPYRGVLAAETRAFVEALGPMIAASDTDQRQQALGTFCLMFGALSLSRAMKGTPLSNELLQAAVAFGSEAVQNVSPERAKITGITQQV